MVNGTIKRMKTAKAPAMSQAETSVRQKIAALSAEFKQLQAKKQETLNMQEAIERRMLQVSGAINEIYPTLPKRP